MNFVPVLEKFSENYILWILQYNTLSKTFYTSTTWRPELLWFRYRTEKTTEYLSIFSPNVRKYGSEKTPNLDTFYAVNLVCNVSLKLPITIW